MDMSCISVCGVAVVEEEEHAGFLCDTPTRTCTIC